MRSVLRLVLVLVFTVGFLAPSIASAHGRADPGASGRPCPTKTALKLCFPSDAAKAAVPRGGPTSPADAPCQGAKAVEAAAWSPPARRTARTLAFETGSPELAGWAPPGIDPPPRS